MGVIFDYFAAPSDEEAAAVIDRVGGPGSRDVLVGSSTPAKRRLFGRIVPPDRSVAEDSGLTIYSTVSLKGIDPMVQMGTLESLLTGRAYEEVAGQPRSGHTVADRYGGERVVCTLTDSLATALAEADPETLAQVAEPWSKTEEFWGQADPEALTGVLSELAALARHARESGQRLYCWVCV